MVTQLQRLAQVDARGLDARQLRRARLDIPMEGIVSDQDVQSLRAANSARVRHRQWWAKPLAAASATAALGWAEPAFAAACCGSSHGLGQQLGMAERAAASFSLKYTEQIGTWDSKGSFVSTAGRTERELREELGFVTRAGKRLQIGLGVPFVYTWKGGGTASSSGGGIGDVTASGRADLLRASGWAPTVALTLSAVLPTGRPARRSSDPLVADLTGNGFGEIRPGLVLEESGLEGWFATLGTSVGLRTSFFEKNGVEVQPSPRLQLFAAAGPTWDSGFSLSVGGIFERESGPSLDGEGASPAATRYRTSMLGVAVYDLTPEWTALFSAQLDLPLSSVGQNETISISPVLGIRYVWGGPS